MNAPKPVFQTQNISGWPQPNQYALYITGKEASYKHIGAMWSFIFNEDKELLLVETAEGALRLPGGKRDYTMALTAKIDAYIYIFEDTYVKSEKELQPLAYAQFEFSGPEEDNKEIYPYPTYCEQYYVGHVEQMVDFYESEQFKARHFLSLRECYDLPFFQNKPYQLLLKALEQ